VKGLCNALTLMPAEQFLRVPQGGARGCRYISARGPARIIAASGDSNKQAGDLYRCLAPSHWVTVTASGSRLSRNW
jgi:hypothetical protein